MKLARQKQLEKHFHEAIAIYGNALDAANILVTDNTTPTEINRYIRTATELAYAARHGEGHFNFELLVSTVESTLEKGLYPANVKLLLKPVRDVAFSCILDVDRWMTNLYFLDQHSNQVIH